MCRGPSRTPVSDGQSRTPVPTILDYSNILMRRSLKSLFLLLIFLKPSVHIKREQIPILEAGVVDSLAALGIVIFV